MLEKAYRQCMVHALSTCGLQVDREVPVAVQYEGCTIDNAFRADLVVDQSVVVELKSVDRLLPIHDAQLLTYLRFLKVRVGLLLNFNVTRIDKGVRRLVL